MKRPNWIVAFLCTALLAALSIVMPLDAIATEVEACATTVDERPVVLFVHGMDGSPNSFGESNDSNSMRASVELVSKVRVVEPFNYSDNNLKWATNENIGPALARQINCLSAASLEAGGNGKIIIVAHSMGGLALREALNQNVTTHTSPDKIGLAITIGTPHLGSRLAGEVAGYWYTRCNGFNCVQSEAARAMKVGSSQLASLPRMPNSIPLRAIAGDIVTTAPSWGGTTQTRHGDYVVSVASAIDQHTTAYPGDGAFTIECRPVVSIGVLFGWIPIGAPCEHGALLRNTQVQTKVVQALGEYVNSLPDPEPTPSPSVPTPTPSPGGGCNQPTPSATPSEEVIGGVGGGPSAAPCP